ncbi:MAG: hypothetical protein M0R77_17550 [Gammaproteobacteria bacterium]|nr:hypothetical protein [Gammaproteobacteria bacterium]
MTNFAFDVDGTLTDSRRIIDPAFKEFFLNFTKENTVYLVTGSDYPKTLEQVGDEILNSVEAVFCCCGNAEYRKGQLISQSDFKVNDQLRSFFLEMMNESQFYPKTGNHIEERIGMVNFSIVGRNATLEDRQDYIIWDKMTYEREIIKSCIEDRFDELEVTLGGETGLDIYPKGKDKSQVADLISPFIFFGDRIEEGGNDLTIAQKATIHYNVSGWKDTYSILKEKYTNGKCE